MKLSKTLEKARQAAKKAPTKISGTLDGNPIDVREIKHGYQFPFGYGVTFDGSSGTHKILVEWDAAKHSPTVSIDGHKMRKPSGGKVLDIDTHFLKMSFEFRWMDLANVDHVLKVSVSKSPFAGLF